LPDMKMQRTLQRVTVQSKRWYLESGWKNIITNHSQFELTESVQPLQDQRLHLG
jgi:hypothetical protein